MKQPGLVRLVAIPVLPDALGVSAVEEELDGLAEGVGDDAVRAGADLHRINRQLYGRRRWRRGE
jgi:hypothetical protein